MPYSVRLKNHLEEGGHEVKLVTKSKEVSHGDVLFLLSCFEIIGKEVMERNRHNIVVHESDLPHGRGWSPASWQILEGKNEIPITLFEARERVDSGAYYIKDRLQLSGNELLHEWHNKLGCKTVEMCIHYINHIDTLKGIEQEGESSYYSRRTPQDSQLDIGKTIEEQFNLLRIVDNEKYPAFFIIKGQRYELRIKKADER